MTRNIVKMLQEYSQIFFFISAVRECHKIKVILVGIKYLFNNEQSIIFSSYAYRVSGNVDSRSQKYEDGKSTCYDLKVK